MGGDESSRGVAAIQARARSAGDSLLSARFRLELIAGGIIILCSVGLHSAARTRGLSD